MEAVADLHAEQLATWLRTHPGVDVVCRDGSLAYRQGIADGAPDARCGWNEYGWREA
ncbi:hypothetical protein AB0E67_34740 [Streptomyces sp. NPDC032161]|uniref:hypothetical protein n=1 Tax=unclassified Streptomyces TaxID=2593676 RepID=UPI0033D97377